MDCSTACPPPEPAPVKLAPRLAPSVDAPAACSDITDTASLTADSREGAPAEREPDARAAGAEADTWAPGSEAAVPEGERRHHLLRHELPEGRRGCAALRFFGVDDVHLAVKQIKKMAQRELQAMFVRVFGARTHSNNNNWLRRKLFEAIGVDPVKGVKKAAGGGAGGRRRRGAAARPRAPRAPAGPRGSRVRDADEEWFAPRGSHTHRGVSGVRCEEPRVRYGLRDEAAALHDADVDDDEEHGNVAEALLALGESAGESLEESCSEGSLPCSTGAAQQAAKREGGSAALRLLEQGAPLREAHQHLLAAHHPLHAADWLAVVQHHASAAAAAAGGDGAPGEAPRQWNDYTVHFAFPEPTELAPPLLQLIDASFKYPGRDDFGMRDMNIGIDMGSRVAIVGPNGAGKSTLMNLLAGDLTPTEGEQRRSHKLRVGRYAQHFVDALRMDETPVDYLLSRFPESGLKATEMRAMLGRFGLSGHHHLQPIVKLSGGQKARVVFTSIALSNPHILLLDEPTNHLDMQSIDALADALEEFEGGVVIISHDARLLSRVCDDEEMAEVWIVEDGEVHPWDGDFADYKDELIREIAAEMDAQEAEEARRQAERDEKRRLQGKK